MIFEPALRGTGERPGDVQRYLKASRLSRGRRIGCIASGKGLWACCGGGGGGAGSAHWIGKTLIFSR